MDTWLATAPGDRFFQAMREGGHPCWLGAFPMQDRYLDMLDPKDFRFFLDSGAYSAWSRNSVIDLDEYCAFIKANIELIDVYASLDVIPGSPGQPTTERQRHEAAEQSWRNYMYMKLEGLDPMPVYHYGEDMKYLERMLQHEIPYIGLGGLVGVPSQFRRVWLDRVFDRITDTGGKPIVKVHGFGMTSVPLIFRYPWYSVDSTTWIRLTAVGGLFLPAVVNGEFVFDRVPRTVTVSKNSPKQKQAGGGIGDMSGAMKEILNRWVTDCGQTMEQVESDYYHRAVCNVTYFRKVSEAKVSAPWKRSEVKRPNIWGD